MPKNKPFTPPRPLTYEEYTKKVNSLKTMSDVSNFAKELIGPTLQAMLEAEMSHHLGYEKHSSSGNNTGNNRNGYSPKTVKTNFGEAGLKIPRDRKGAFDPIAVKKYQTVESDVEEKIVSMYAKGMTTRDINEHLEDIYGVHVSAAMISTITDKVLPLVTEWQSRPLDEVYAIIYLDGIHFKIRDSGRIINKCCYTILGITRDGQKELLGLWVGQTEGAKFWLQLLNEIQSRGVKDILIACVDGLPGFKEAINTVFPDCQVQQCIIHQVRNTIRYIPHKHRKRFCQQLREVYSAPTEQAGLQALEQMKQDWPQYASYLKSWEVKWDELAVFFQYPDVVRKLIYTNNAIESVHRQLRKVTKTTTIFPHEEALTKLLWLAQRDISKRWTSPIRNWGEIMAQLVIIFPERIKL
jgi:transposase-like protein